MSRIRTAPDERLYAYLLACEPPEPEELRNLRDLTEAMPNARMQILPEQGHFLALLVKLIGARRVLEVGTFTGYSAMAMALALPPDGRVVTCDLHEEPIGVGRPLWKQAGVAAKIDVIIGPALDTLGRLEGGNVESFDLVFIDADKTAYGRYYEFALRLVRPGGLIVLDNVLQRGEVADPGNNDPRTMSLRALNAKIARDDRIDRVMLPIADGMTLARRRQ
jgi:O-methyltransferase